MGFPKAIVAATWELQDDGVLNAGAGSRSATRFVRCRKAPLTPNSPLQPSASAV
jgi:hypothetical protein